MKNPPIFIHSLFRSGSTYVFNVFRRARQKYSCYQEPLNEYLIHAATEPNKLLEFDREKQEYLRHPELNKPYFYEFHQIAGEVGHLFKKEFSYDHYFSTSKDHLEDINNYFQMLQNSSERQPVLQCCRTSGRVSGIKKACGGVHIFLWRNPWDQWWSYKRDHYFDMCNLLILNAKELPEFLLELKKEIKFLEFHDKNTFVEYDYFRDHRLDSKESYKLFYALWCHAMIEAKPNCEISIDIDKLSTSKSYKNTILSALQTVNINGIDFSDCSIPIAKYGKSDGDFFITIENQVHELLNSHGYSNLQLDELKHLCEERKKSIKGADDTAIRDAMRVREYLYRTEKELAEVRRLFADRGGETEQENFKWLHNEWESSKSALAKQQEKANQLESEWAYTKSVLAEQLEKNKQLEREWVYTKSVLAEQQKKLNEANEKIDELSHEANKWWLATDRLERELHAVYNSKSWKVTRPLRKLVFFYNQLFTLIRRFTLWVISIPRRIVHRFFVWIISFLINHPRIKSRAIFLLGKFPKIHRKLFQSTAFSNLISASRASSQSKYATNLSKNTTIDSRTEYLNLTSSAQRIYSDLKIAIAQHKKKDS